MGKIYLSVVIPCFDEMTNLQKGVLEKVAQFLSGKQYSFEVIIVDDGSTDGSVTYVEEFTKKNPRFSLVKNHHTGKAGAVTAGVLQAQGDHVLFADMDQATPIEELDKLLPHFSEGYDVVIGSRKGTRKGSPFSRRIISQGVIVLRKVVLGLSDLSDTQCGFKAFTKGAAKSLFTKIEDVHHGFKARSGSAVTAGFDMELLLLAEKAGFKIKEVPVNWQYVETRRVSPVRDSIEGVIDLFQIKVREMQGVYDK